MSQKVTISDIADAAGVSIATVSRAFNNKGNIKQSTKNLIYEVARKLGYKIPVHLEYTDFSDSENNRNILMLVPQLSNPFYTLIFDGAQDIAFKHGYRLMISQPPKDSLASKDYLLQLGNSSPFAGLILLQTIPEDVAFLYKQSGLPFVQCSEFSEDYDTSYISIDDVLAAKNATEYLISIGRTKIAFINSPLTYKYAREREEGFCSAMKQASLDINPDWLYHLPDISFDVAFSSVMQLLQQPNIPNAIFTVSDVYAAAAIKAATRLGLRVPQDIAVVGFDDIEISTMIEPSITTVSQPRYQLGSLSCNILIDHINNPNAGSQKILLDTHLIMRESSKV